MSADLLWSGTREPIGPPEPILQHEERQGVHCQGTFNQTLFLGSAAQQNVRYIGDSGMVLVCAGHWTPPSLNRSTLSPFSAHSFSLQMLPNRGLSLSISCTKSEPHAYLILRNASLLPKRYGANFSTTCNQGMDFK